MVNIIVGGNGEGKTKLLKDLYDEKQNNAVTNFVYDTKSEYIQLSSEKIDDLAGILDLQNMKVSNTDIMYGEYEDAFRKSALEKETLSVLSLLCKDRLYIFLDEPERNIGSEDVKVIAEFLSERETEDFVWITTHAIQFSNIKSAVYYKVVNGDLIQIEQGEVYECIDSV
ncbi:MAG: hypothetical protein IJE43_02105 [Alphaproteobacteria bacterium]|nr:hypothetical protein [Alphaproteobacteria bacterium]